LISTSRRIQFRSRITLMDDHKPVRNGGGNAMIGQSLPWMIRLRTIGSLKIAR